MEHCLRNSNWWTLQRVKTADRETFSYYDFVAALRIQIERQLAKTEKNGEFVLNGGYTVDGIQTLLEEHQFSQKLQPQCGEKGEGGDYFPLLTFHATKNVGAVRSIAKHGYFMPGELHPIEGFTFKMQHGQYHGEGVYTSTRFDTAQWFSFFDRDNVVQLLVNFVFLGKTHFVNDDPPEQLLKVRDGYHALFGGNGQMWSKTTSTANPEYDRGILYTVHGEYGNGAHTRLLPDLSVIVSGSGERVIPLAIVTLKPNWNCAWIKPYLRDKTTLLSLERKFTLESEPTTLYRICDDWHVIEPPKAPKKAEKKKGKEKKAEGKSDDSVRIATRHHFVLPVALLKNDTFSKNQLRDFFGATNSSKKRLFLYDDNDFCVYTDFNGADQFESALVTSASSFSSPSSASSSSSSSSSSSIDAGVGALKALVSAFETITDEEKRVVETVYFVVDVTRQPFVVNASVSEFVSKYERLVATARQTIVKIIRFGTSDTDFSLVNKFKYRLQTVEHYESCLQHNVPLATDWPLVIDTLLEESATLCSQNSQADTIDYTVPMPYGVVGEGFVVDLVYNPLWGERHFERNALYKGYAPLPALGIGEKHHPVRYITREQVVKTLLEKEGISSQDFEEQRKEREQAGQNYGRMTKLFGDGVVRLLCRFKTFVVRSQGRVQAYRGAVAMLCESVLRELKTVQDEPELVAFCDLQHLRRTCCQIQTLLSDVNVFATVRFTGEWFDALMQMRFAKKILRRAGSRDNKQIEGGEQFEPPKEWESLVGYRAQLRTTAASQVEPWLIIVDSLCNKQSSALSSYASQQQQQQQQQQLQEVEEEEKPFNIVPLEQTRKFGQLQYYAFAFTGNPYLLLVSQPRALPAVAWVRSLELLFRRNDARDDDAHVVAVSKKKDYLADWDRCWTLYECVRRQNEKRCDMVALLREIDAEKDETRLAKHMTEAVGVMSMCQLLAAMTVYKGGGGEEKFNHLAFAMMAECVMRNCRAYLRERGLTVNQVVRKTLGIDEQTPAAGFSVNIKDSVARTGQFFRRRFTNCSPFALVAALGFLQRVHRGESKEQIWRAYDENEISMSRFLHEHFPRSTEYDDVVGQEVQLALFLQGVRFHKARLRTELRFNNPRNIIRQSAEEQLALLANEKRARSMAQDRRTLRLQRRLDEAAPYNAYHQRLKLFTIDEVDEFNRKQSSPADWAVLLPESGLLLHHCCYVDCPQFMHNFATKEDRECKRTTHKRRHGIIQHFRHNHASGNYVPGFHLMARRFAKEGDYEQFVRKMDKHFASSEVYSTLKNKEWYLRDAYEFHQSRR